MATKVVQVSHKVVFGLFEQTYNPITSLTLLDVGGKNRNTPPLPYIQSCKNIPTVPTCWC